MLGASYITWRGGEKKYKEKNEGKCSCAERVRQAFVCIKIYCVVGW